MKTSETKAEYVKQAWDLNGQRMASELVLNSLSVLMLDKKLYAVGQVRGPEGEVAYRARGHIVEDCADLQSIVESVASWHWDTHNDVK